MSGSHYPHSNRFRRRGGGHPYPSRPNYPPPREHPLGEAAPHTGRFPRREDFSESSHRFRRRFDHPRSSGGRARVEEDHVLDRRFGEHEEERHRNRYMGQPHGNSWRPENRNWYNDASEERHVPVMESDRTRRRFLDHPVDTESGHFHQGRSSRNNSQYERFEAPGPDAYSVALAHKVSKSSSSPRSSIPATGSPIKRSVSPIGSSRKVTISSSDPSDGSLLSSPISKFRSMPIKRSVSPMSSVKLTPTPSHNLSSGTGSASPISKLSSTEVDAMNSTHVSPSLPNENHSETNLSAEDASSERGVPLSRTSDIVDTTISNLQTTLPSVSLLSISQNLTSPNNSTTNPKPVSFPANSSESLSSTSMLPSFPAASNVLSHQKSDSFARVSSVSIASLDSEVASIN